MQHNDIRRKSTHVIAGNVQIGGNAPISVQSMLTTDPHDANACIAMCRRLCDAGCDVIRMTIPDKQAIYVIDAIKQAGITAPLVADIHFDYRLALEACAAGIDKIRINPGNIGSDEHIHAVASACATRHIPIRIGVNSGSLEKQLLATYGGPTAQALAESALRHAALLEKFDFNDIVISVKSSNVRTMIQANRILAQRCMYPLLAEGIGDTIRVSLTDDPVLEVEDARTLLEALALLPGGTVHIISCPTCGRTKIPLVTLVNEFERRARQEIHRKTPIQVAIMGCAVNGPGEAREADIGLAGGDGQAAIFRKNQILCRVRTEEAVDTLIRYINELPDE